MKFQKNDILNLAAAAINPSLGLALSLYLLLRRAKPSWLGFSFALALIYSYMPIMWDSWSNFTNVYYFEINLNFFDTATEYITRVGGIDYIAASFLYAFTIIYILCKKIGSPLISKASRGSYLLGLLLFFTTLEYRGIMDIQKTALSLAIFILAYDSEKPAIKYAFFATSIIIHPFSLLALACVYLGRPLNKLTSGALLSIVAGLALISVLDVPSRILEIISNMSFAPRRIEFYLTENPTRFSSEKIYLVVKTLRLASVTAVAICAIKLLSRDRDQRTRRNSAMLLAICLTCYLCSPVETLLERAYFLMCFFSAYTIAHANLRKRIVAGVASTIILNTFIHGGYTLSLAHSERYDVLGTQEERISQTIRGLLHPSVALLNFSAYGLSDEDMMSAATKRW